jgi:hypothetical protein
MDDNTKPNLTDFPPAPEIKVPEPLTRMPPIARAAAACYVRRMRALAVALPAAVALSALLWPARSSLHAGDEPPSVATRSAAAPAKEKPASALVSVKATADLPLAVVPAAAKAKPEPMKTAVARDTAFDLGDLSENVTSLEFLMERAERSVAAKTKTLSSEAATVPAVETATSTELPADDGGRGGMEAADRAIYDRLVEARSKAEGSKDEKALKAAERELAMFRSTLSTEIEFRIVAGKGRAAGFWRGLKTDSSQRQYFVVVEAVVDGKPVNWAVRDVDTGRVVSGPDFGLRVDEATFKRISDDRKSPGVDDTTVGVKPVGRISPVWSIKTDGETITGYPRK